ISANITWRVLHGVVDCHACGNRAAWRVNVERNIASRILCRKQKNLRAQLVRNLVINLGAQEDDAITKQALINAVSQVHTRARAGALKLVRHGQYSLSVLKFIVFLEESFFNVSGTYTT